MKQAVNTRSACLLLPIGYLLRLLLDSEDGGNTFLRNIAELPEYTTLHPKDLILRCLIIPGVSENCGLMNDVAKSQELWVDPCGV
jgi:hypothetical protein